MVPVGDLVLVGDLALVGDLVPTLMTEEVVVMLIGALAEVTDYVQEEIHLAPDLVDYTNLTSIA